MPGHQIGKDEHGLRLAIHNGIAGTFLQHPKMRPGEKQPRRMPIGTVDDDGGSDLFTYKAVDSYAHQKAQGTGLLDGKLICSNDGETIFAMLPQSVVPGAMSGATALQAKPEEVLLLLYLMVGCAIFLLRPRTYKEKAQYCVVVPDVTDLEAFADALRQIAATGQKIERFSNSYLGRVVRGAEEAALSFLIDLQSGDVAREGGVSGCLAVAMGKVAWDKNQINRSVIAKLKNNYAELGVFRAAKPLGKSKTGKNENGESYVIPGSPVPELVAANLAAERHWCAHFRELVEQKKDFEARMSYDSGGLKNMKNAVKDEIDQTAIRAFQEAWKLKMSALYERGKELMKKADKLMTIERGKGNVRQVWASQLVGERLVSVERERMRNAILREKTGDGLASWFLRFCADATRDRPSASLAKDLTQLRTFIFNPRNYERFQNLCLFSLVSYARDESAARDNTTTKEGGKG
ncbi:MAG: type I-MYXAN CRISPR-associated Cas8a1/Cmx1 [Acidobacteria bacterium]|nr:type I-MYXAN CRISPR-associated Cas8a1/Cmx1 [Acidobacteriota bacterium]